MMRDPEAFLVNAFNEYGPVFRVRLGLDDYTVLMGDEARAFFLRSGEKSFTRQPFYGRFARELGCDYFILSEPQGGMKHFRLRKMMRLGFSRESCAPYVPQMVDAVRAAALNWRPGACISVMDAMARHKAIMRCAKSRHTPTCSTSVSMADELLLDVPGVKTVRVRTQS